MIIFVFALDNANKPVELNHKKNCHMLDDIKKSFSSVLYERTTSPFYGTLICTWVIWNWKIIYLTFFVSADIIKENKIDYIVKNYSDIWHIVWCPLISTIILLTLIPFVSNGAYWLSIIFNKWKIDKKNEVDRLQLLSLEQSIDLREEISKQAETFDKMLEKKSLEIKQLNSLLDEYKNQSNKEITTKDKNVNIIEKDKKLNTEVELQEFNTEVELQDFNLIYNKIINDGYLQNFENLTSAIRYDQNILNDDNHIPSSLITLLEVYDIIAPTGNGFYMFLDKGKRFRKFMISNKT